MQTEQLSSFNARIARINNPRNSSYVDAETGMKVPKRVSKNIILKNAKKAPPSVVALFMALVLGCICLMGSRLARFTVLDMPQTNDTTLVVEMSIAAIAAFVMGGMLGQKTLRHMMAQVVGASVMAVAMHNLVWMFPEEFALVYPQTFVDQVQSETQPLSIYVRGQTFTI